MSHQVPDGLCPDCGNKLDFTFDPVDEDEFHDGTEQVEVAAECSKCGWSAC